jgi:hypothetical protein
MSIPINLAVEDSLSETVLRKLLEATKRDFSVGYVYGRGGNGYLRKTIEGWNNAAKGTPLLLLTDLDMEECPLSLISKWLSTAKQHNLLFRVAVREVEAWLLADAGLATYLSVASRLMPENPESVDDPKAEVIKLASRSRSSELRRSLIPRPGSTAKQGPGYNSCLEEFVRKSWDVNRARQRSASLDRTLARLSAFVPLWSR